MKERYKYLKDNDGNAVIIICEIPFKGTVELTERNLTAIGIAIRSVLDSPNDDRGREIAFRRAVRAKKARQTCFIRRPEVYENIYQLVYHDYMYFVDQVMNGHFLFHPKGWVKAC